MAEISDPILVAKNALMVALNDNQQKYLDNMRNWFRHKWSKEDFDLECRKLLPPEHIHLHNQFLLAILNKIDVFHMPQQQTIPTPETYSTGTRGNNKRKRNSKFFGERIHFEAFDLYDFVQDTTLETARPLNLTDVGQDLQYERYCVQEMFLPDAGFIMGRLLVGAWENGLDNVDNRAAEYVASAVQILLKNIITAVILKRKHCRITGEGTFFYDAGCPAKDLFLRNTVTRQKIDDSPLELDKEITSPTVNLLRRPNDDPIFLSACEEPYPQEKEIIKIRDLYLALRDRNIILSHAVYSINMERITQMLH